MQYVECLKKRCDVGYRNFYDAIDIFFDSLAILRYR